MLLDTRTIYLLAFFYSLLVGVIFLLLYKDHSGSVRLSMKTWGAAYILAMLGWGLSASRNFLPEVVAVIFGNGFLLLAQSEIIQALRQFEGRLPIRKLTLALVASGLLANAYFFLVKNNLSIRVVIISTSVAVLYGLAAVQAAPIRGAVFSKSHAITCLGFWGMTGVFAVRALDYLLADRRNIQSIFAGSPIESFVFGAGVLGIVLVTFGFLLMCNEKFNDELKQLARSDTLTGLYNRRALEELSRQAISHARRANEPLSYMMIDADNFKHINDTFGHQVGDRALKQIGDLIRNHLRAQDMLFRLGGDEFSALLPGTDGATSRMIAERLKKVIQEAPFSFGGHTIPLSVSIGISEFSQASSDFESLAKQADLDLYAEKREAVAGPV